MTNATILALDHQLRGWYPAPAVQGHPAGGPRTGVDVRARLSACYAAVAASDATAATGGSATAPLLAVAKADVLTGHIPRVGPQ